MAGGRLSPSWVTRWDVHDEAGAVEVPLHPETGEPYERVRLVVTNGRAPISVIDAPIAGTSIDPSDLIGAGVTDLPRAAEEADAPEPGAPLRISVIITSHDRPTELAHCLKALQAQTRPPDEIIVVDNGTAAARLVGDAILDDDRIRCFQVPPVGMTFSRNTGADLSDGDVLAFLTDDAITEPYWLEEIEAGLSDESIACVIGPTLPLRLDNPGQIMFEQAFNWTAKQGFEQRVLEPVGQSDDPLHPYRLADFPAGTQVTVRREWFERLGGFDTNLGAGTLVGGGDDLDFCSRMLLGGARVELRPSALAWHDDNTTEAMLPGKMHSYGTGLTGFLAKHLLDRSCRRVLLRRIPVGVKLLWTRPWKVEGIDAVDDSVDIPTALTLQHLRGRVVGPIRYLRTRYGSTRPRAAAPHEAVLL